jgi:hypothetical protein
MAKKQWDEPSFFKELRKQGGQSAENTCRRLLKWCQEEEFKIHYGVGQKEGTLIPSVLAAGGDRRLFEVFTFHLGRPGYVLMASYLWRKWWPETPFVGEAQEQFNSRLNRLPLNKQLRLDEQNKRPFITLEQLSNPEDFELFKEVYRWIVGKIRATKK